MEEHLPSSRKSWLRAASVFPAACLILLLLAFLLSRDASRNPSTTGSIVPASPDASSGHASKRGRIQRAARPGATATEIVAGKVSQFGRNRRAIAEAMASKANVTLPEDVRRFFAAVEAGNWPEADALFQSLRERRKAEPPPADLMAVWPAVFEAYGVAEIAQRWPAQKLLDYGNSVLNSLRPGMVYVGGTDPGRWIPTLLNDTTDGARHVVLTQNALADGSYLEYLSFLHGDNMTTLTKADSDRAFSEYIAGAQKRFLHDQEFPDEPKQIKPGEDVRMVDGRIQVSGQIAVMSINELLLQTFMENNPNLSFALEESFPLRSTYSEASPLGPIMELGVQEGENGLTQGKAAESLNYWQTISQELLSDPEASMSPEALKSYSKLIVSHGNLFAGRGYSSEAEDAYRIARNVCPHSLEAVGNLAKLLRASGRQGEADQIVREFVAQYPDQQSALLASYSP